MGELIELFETDVEIVTEKEEKLPKHALARLYYGFAVGDRKNINGRIYSSDLLSKRIEEKSKEIKESGVLGQLDHPLDGKTKLQKAMHVLECLTYDKEDKNCYAESLVLNTTAGRDFMTILNAGAKLGSSMRGWGNVHPVSGKVQKDWKLESIDFVLNPSFGKDASIDKTNLIESANSLMIDEDPVKELREQKRKEKIKEHIDNLLQKDYDSACYSGRWYGDYASYHKEHCKGLYEHYGIVESSADKKKAEKKGPRKRFQVRDIIGEALIAGVDPEAYCEKLNAQIDREEELEQIAESEAIPVEDIKAILSEARKAGVDTSTEEAIKKQMEIAKKSKASKVKPLTEEEQKKKDKQDDINSQVREKMIASKVFN